MTLSPAQERALRTLEKDEVGQVGYRPFLVPTVRILKALGLVETKGPHRGGDRYVTWNWGRRGEWRKNPDYLTVHLTEAGRRHLEHRAS